MLLSANGNQAPLMKSMVQGQYITADSLTDAGTVGLPNLTTNKLQVFNSVKTSSLKYRMGLRSEGQVSPSKSLCLSLHAHHIIV